MSTPITFLLVSGGSVLMSDLAPGMPHEMITKFHRDGEDLLATHYCLMGNQPRMRAVASVQPNVVAFEFKDAKNLPDPAVAHMGGVKFTFVDYNHHVEEWTVVANGRTTFGSSTADESRSWENRKSGFIPEKEKFSGEVNALRYMLLIYTQEIDNASREEMAQVFAGHVAVQEETARRGILRACDPLKTTASATTVRVQDSKVLVTDGPFAETKEQLAGYYILDCADLDEAVEWAAKIPSACGGATGCVEVRPIREVTPPARAKDS